MRLATTVLLLLTLLPCVNPIPVDNGVEGEPEIECGPRSITVNFNTRRPFEGHVYVKGLFDQQGCRTEERGRQVAGIELPFSSCNVARTRSLNPKGIFVSTTVVISFHPQFVTKVDRAYRIQCFYMEADKTVSSQIEVSEITTAFQTQVVPMPVCRYEILEGGPSGQQVQFATIGQQVYHKWTCESETVDTFCAVVHSCVVDDGNGDTVQILNEEGCALDKFLLNNLEYPTDLMAGQEAHVYKYADRSQLFYQCQITITIKEPNSECPRPKCPEPSGFNAVKLGGGGGSGAAPTSPQQPAHAVPAPSPSAPSVPSAAGPASPAVAPPAPPAAAAPSAPAAATSAPTSVLGRHLATASNQYQQYQYRRPQAALLRLLKKREAGFNDGNTLDVRTELTALDIIDGQNSVPDTVRRHRADKSYSSYSPPSISLDATTQNTVCISTFGISLLFAIGAAALLILIILSVCFLRPFSQFK